MMSFPCLLVLAATAGVQPSSVSAGGRPNVVFILADDLGRVDCGFMGGKSIKTPNLDRLAKTGMILDAFYVQPVCSPTRAALMTGRYPMRHGLQVGVVRPWSQYGLPLEERTLSTALKEAGYTTALIGKWHLGHFQPEYLPTRRGFDHQYGHYNGAIDYFTHVRDGGFDWHRNDRECRDEGYSTHLLAKEAVSFVESHADKPFFLYVPFNAVHSPMQVPEKYLEAYPELKGNRKKYAGMLAAMDEAVGHIVDAVDRAGLRGNTLFIFSSDNGGPSPGTVTDNGIFRAGKGTLYEGGVRVAAFASWPGHIKEGTVLREPVHMVDWFPTLVNLAGGNLKQTQPLDGKDIWPVLTQGAPSPHEALLLNTTPDSGAIRMGDWKLVYHKQNTQKKKKKARGSDGEWELFNLRSDPGEEKNLVDAHAEIAQKLKARLDAYAQQAVPPKNKPKAKDFVVPKVWGQ